MEPPAQMKVNPVVKQTRDQLKEFRSPLIIKKKIKTKIGKVKTKIPIVEDDPYITEGSPKNSNPKAQMKESFD